MRRGIAGKITAMTNLTVEAAHELAAVLRARADDLASDELATVAEAMTAVRVAARAVEAALTARGWGGDVLYGFGDPVHDDLDDADDEDDADEEDVEDEDTGDVEEFVAPRGRRMTYQSRVDFVVVDEDALLDHVERRAAELGDTGWTRDSIIEHNPAFVLWFLGGPGTRDFEGAGIVSAGAQDVVAEVPVTLWELDHEARGDCYPVN
ncbi:hypothetical protein V5P93_003298 [Actinokineospora auranticolor]|uniref:Uncharacterized protein n=1 Tax=Actinokineospora auranticolor TaxID=155976 RepID=A0A2S6H1T2_9PSEU|nr:hypothetical protein [Actinokineospora auranticolor]PPK71432.1 hypothetical protein CLV40_101622 [Actinokineospora auranticolor]